jgi:hypothetical protein
VLRGAVAYPGNSTVHGGGWCWENSTWNGTLSGRTGRSEPSLPKPLVEHFAESSAE